MNTTDELVTYVKSLGEVVNNLIDLGVLPDHPSTILLNEQLHRANEAMLELVFKYTKEKYGVLDDVILIRPQNARYKMYGMVHKLFQRDYTIAQVDKMLEYVETYTGLTVGLRTHAYVVNGMDIDTFETYLSHADLVGLDWQSEILYEPGIYLRSKLEHADYDEELYRNKYYSHSDTNDIVTNMVKTIFGLIDRGVKPSSKMVTDTIDLYTQIKIYLTTDKRLSIVYDDVAVPNKIQELLPTISNRRTDCQKFIEVVNEYVAKYA